jgi:hypothetical protein
MSLSAGTKQVKLSCDTSAPTVVIGDDVRIAP